VLFETPAGPNWQVRVVPSVRPLYRIEGDTERAADGIYDRMALVGADEIVIESPDHGRSLADMADAEIVRVMDAWAARITDLKRDGRFKYITVFKNKGLLAGEDWTHSYSQVTATTFVPRRILYELRAAREWFRDRERCVFCDILRQEERTAKRVVDSQGDYVAFCPYASRVPYEFWIMPRPHNHQFEAPLPGANRGTSQPCSGECSGASGRFPRIIIWWCTPRQMRGKIRVNWPITGERFRATITGTSRCYRSCSRAASPIALRKSISMACCPKRPRKGCG
jgi:hypothetical protein